MQVHLHLGQPAAQSPQPLLALPPHDLPDGAAQLLECEPASATNPRDAYQIKLVTQIFKCEEEFASFTQFQRKNDSIESDAGPGGKRVVDGVARLLDPRQDFLIVGSDAMRPSNNIFARFRENILKVSDAMNA